MLSNQLIKEFNHVASEDLKKALIMLTQTSQILDQYAPFEHHADTLETMITEVEESLNDIEGEQNE